MSRRTFTYAVHICLSTDKTCALKVKRINYPASGPSRTVCITVYMKGPKQKGRISLENLEVGFFSGSERTK